jgi:hypothetical protein
VYSGRDSNPRLFVHEAEKMTKGPPIISLTELTLKKKRLASQIEWRGKKLGNPFSVSTELNDFLPFS